MNGVWKYIVSLVVSIIMLIIFGVVLSKKNKAIGFISAFCGNALIVLSAAIIIVSIFNYYNPMMMLLKKAPSVVMIKCWNVMANAFVICIGVNFVSFFMMRKKEAKESGTFAKKCILALSVDVMAIAISCVGLYFLLYKRVSKPMPVQAKTVVISTINETSVEKTGNEADKNNISNSEENDGMFANENGQSSNVDNLPGASDADTRTECETRVIEISYYETDILKFPIFYDHIEKIDKANKSTEHIGTYNNDTTQITVDKKMIGEGDECIVYFVADVNMSDASVLCSVIANRTFSEDSFQSPKHMCDEQDMILAITGDSCGMTEYGYEIKNGVLYRDELTDADMCIIYRDGTMETKDIEGICATNLRSGEIYNTLCFGPALLDGNGNLLEHFNTHTYLSVKHPRSAIGYIDKNHYVFVVVEGRNVKGSSGASITELAYIMKLEGCMLAYNLDGGGAIAMYFDGEILNGGEDRSLSDMIGIRR